MAVRRHANAVLRKNDFRIRPIDAFLEHRNLNVPSPKNPPWPAQEAPVHILQLSLRPEGLKPGLSQLPPVHLLMTSDQGIWLRRRARLGECVEFIQDRTITRMH